MGRMILRTVGSGLWRNRCLHVVAVQFLNGEDMNRKEEWLTTTILYLSYLNSSVLFQGLFVFMTSLIFIVSLCDLYFCYAHFIDKEIEMLS